MPREGPLAYAPAMTRGSKPTAFVSTQRVDGEPAASLVLRLQSEGWKVLHSPRNPLDGEDRRWADGYKRGLPEALTAADVFIAVIDEGWDSSTWMGEEAHQAMELKLVSRCCYWNPHGLVVRARGMVPYLRSKLPDDLQDLMRALTDLVG